VNELSECGNYVIKYSTAAVAVARPETRGNKLIKCKKQSCGSPFCLLLRALYKNTVDHSRRRGSAARVPRPPPLRWNLRYRWVIHVRRGPSPPSGGTSSDDIELRTSLLGTFYTLLLVSCPCRSPTLRGVAGRLSIITLTLVVTCS